MMTEHVDPDVDDLAFFTHSPAELRRRLRSVSVLLGAAEHAPRDQLSVLLRARGHLAGTLDKLDRLVAEVRSVPDHIDSELTEPYPSERIAGLP
ncbi:MAG: hypothetical protein HS111_21950 [Kofleriaceae bacterium]|nr:hypothetical protein [Kofleriaceae bacterium]MCL4224356.1 hypothetical protein [Myxococcales bacterium]